MNVLDYETIQPWKIGKTVKNAKHVLELNEGQATKFTKNSKVEVEYGYGCFKGN